MSLVINLLNCLAISRNEIYKKRYAILSGYDTIDFNSKNLRKQLRYKNNSTFKITIYRLKKRGFIKKRNNTWHITKNGKNFLIKITNKIKGKNKYDNLKIDKNKSVIIIFDIPEKYKNKRYWLRTELIILGFKFLQKSVWIGPSPLPEDFIKTLNEHGILRYIKFFKVLNEDLI